MKFRQSLISAHHNYLINQMLTPGFILGEPDAGDDFWLLADVVLPGEKAPYVSGRFYDRNGDFLLHLKGNEIVENQGYCLARSSGGGFSLHYPSGDVLLAVHTEVFTNGYLTLIQGRLYDRKGSLRLEPSFESARVLGPSHRTLDGPARFQEQASCP